MKSEYAIEKEKIHKSLKVLGKQLLNELSTGEWTVAQFQYTICFSKKGFLEDIWLRKGTDTIFFGGSLVKFPFFIQWRIKRRFAQLEYKHQCQENLRKLRKKVAALQTVLIRCSCEPIK